MCGAKGLPVNTCFIAIARAPLLPLRPISAFIVVAGALDGYDYEGAAVVSLGVKLFSDGVGHLAYFLEPCCRLLLGCGLLAAGVGLLFHIAVGLEGVNNWVN